jgi:hypothetical protein
MDDLDLITIGQRALAIQLPYDDFSIHFYGDPSLAESQLADQAGDGQSLAQLLRIAVDDHVHAKKHSQFTSALQHKDHLVSAANLRKSAGPE